MPIFSCPKGILLFAHVPKTGGTSVERVLRKSTARGLFSSTSPAKLGLPCSAQHFHGELLDSLLPPKFVQHSFMVVRHPVDRLVSEYRYRKGLGAFALSIDEWWARWKLAYRRDNYVLDNHLRPQVEFETRGMKVLKFEDGIDAAVAKICAASGLKAPTKPLRRMKKSKGEEIVPGRRLIRSVKSFYRADLERYGYE